MGKNTAITDNIIRITGIKDINNSKREANNKVSLIVPINSQ